MSERREEGSQGRERAARAALCGRQRGARALREALAVRRELLDLDGIEGREFLAKPQRCSDGARAVLTSEGSGLRAARLRFVLSETTIDFESWRSRASEKLSS